MFCLRSSRGARTLKSFRNNVIADSNGSNSSNSSSSSSSTAVSGFFSGNSRRQFHLNRDFVNQYRTRKEPFGFNGLGELVYHRTYSRTKPCGKRERWFETVERVVNGTFSMQERWISSQEMGFDKQAATARAEDMYERIFEMKFLPPGRGLWAMGTAVTEERGLFAALNNCAFVSTADIDDDLSEPFTFLMDAAMLGVGVGFDTKGSDKVKIVAPPSVEQQTPLVFIVPDSRDGWVDSLRVLLLSYTPKAATSTTERRRITFDYSKVRPAGQPIKGFGGTSSGHGPLAVLHDTVSSILDGLDGKPISVTAIVDIMNLIGQCVVAGNVRRTAEIAFGDPDSEEYVDLKDYEKNPHRAAYGWTSNNSVFAKLGMDYSRVCDSVQKNGEPGFAWLENMRAYGRMGREAPEYRDWKAGGGNPCLEQTLESHELCCLVETFPFRHTERSDFEDTLRSALLYAKTVTLGRTHWPKSNRVMMRNRRIGCSISGVSQFVAERGLDNLKDWCESGYDVIQEQDEMLSDEFAIPLSIKTTCVKPSGTVSLLAGATPGMHAPESRFYIRRVRLAVGSDVIEPLRLAGFHLEPSETDKENTLVVSIPVDAGEGVRTAQEMSMWEQLSLAAFLQRHWADNQVSCTVTFDPETEGPQLKHALEYFQYQLKGVSFLPRLEAGAYAQMPYEEISESEYFEMKKGLRPLVLSESDDECSGDAMAADAIAAGAALGSMDNVLNVSGLSGAGMGGVSVDVDGAKAEDLNANGEFMPDAFCDTGFCDVNNGRGLV